MLKFKEGHYVSLRHGKALVARFLSWGTVYSKGFLGKSACELSGLLYILLYSNRQISSKSDKVATRKYHPLRGNRAIPS